MISDAFISLYSDKTLLFLPQELSVLAARTFCSCRKIFFLQQKFKKKILSQDYQFLV